jgi:hypothetical protein
VALLAAAWIAAFGACQLAVGKRGVAEYPRQRTKVRVAVDGATAEVGAATLAALAAQRNIDAQPLAVTDWSATLLQRCDLAKAAGFDYLAHVQLNANELVELKCIQYSFQLHGGCAETGASYKGAIATVSLDMLQVSSCQPYTNLRRGAYKKTSLKGKPGMEKATAQVLASVGTAFAGIFPDQVTLDQTAHVPSSEPVRGEGVFRDYRENHYVGSLRVEAAGTDRERQKLLTCCFQPRPDDLLFKSDSDRVLEFVPGPSVARVSIGGVPHTAAGFGIDLGLRGREGGLQFGVMLEELLTSESVHFLGTLEAGYGFRPTPRWAVSLIAGGGGGIAARRNAPPGESDAQAPHVMGVMRAQLQGGRQWFLRFDAGYVWSSSYDGGATGPPETFLIRGPLVRLGGGLM